MKIQAPRLHFYVFFAMLAGRWSKGEGLGERANPLRAVLDTFDQRVDGFWDPRGRLGTSFSQLFGCLRHHFSGLGDGWRRLEASGGRLEASGGARG